MFTTVASTLSFTAMLFPARATSARLSMAFSASSEGRPLVSALRMT
jgi:hypothetical protein